MYIYVIYTYIHIYMCVHIYHTILWAPMYCEMLPGVLGASAAHMYGWQGVWGYLLVA